MLWLSVQHQHRILHDLVLEIIDQDYAEFLRRQSWELHTHSRIVYDHLVWLRLWHFFVGLDDGDPFPTQSLLLEWLLPLAEETTVHLVLQLANTECSHLLFVLLLEEL